MALGARGDHANRTPGEDPPMPIDDLLGVFDRLAGTVSVLLLALIPPLLLVPGRTARPVRPLRGVNPALLKSASGKDQEIPSPAPDGPLPVPEAERKRTA
jgi:hypothetical protein